MNSLNIPVGSSSQVNLRALIPRCTNKPKRLNLKSKRKRNLIKKAIELSQMLDMDILMVLKCRDTGKVTVYESGGCEQQDDNSS